VTVVTNRPALLLDVDGVLNPLSRPRQGAGFRRHHVQVSPGGSSVVAAGTTFTLWLSPRHGRMLRDLAAECGLELVWATTWEHDANRSIGPAIGLPELAVIEFPLGRMDLREGGSHIWKLPAVEQAMAGRRFAWIDDDFEPDDVAWAADRTSSGLPTLLVPCPPRTGLAQEHIDTVRAWTTGLPAPEPA